MPRRRSRAATERTLATTLRRRARLRAGAAETPSRDDQPDGRRGCRSRTDGGTAPELRVRDDVARPVERRPGRDRGEDRRLEVGGRRREPGLQSGQRGLEVGRPDATARGTRRTRRGAPAERRPVRRSRRSARRRCTRASCCLPLSRRSRPRSWTPIRGTGPPVRPGACAARGAGAPSRPPARSRGSPPSLPQTTRTRRAGRRPIGTPSGRSRTDVSSSSQKMWPRAVCSASTSEGSSSQGSRSVPVIVSISTGRSRLLRLRISVMQTLLTILNSHVGNAPTSRKRLRPFTIRMYASCVASAASSGLPMSRRASVYAARYDPAMRSSRAAGSPRCAARTSSGVTST